MALVEGGRNHAMRPSESTGAHQFLRNEGAEAGTAIVVHNGVRVEE